jgi:hypothetical protein
MLINNIHFPTFLLISQYDKHYTDVYWKKYGFSPVNTGLSYTLFLN